MSGWDTAIYLTPQPYDNERGAHFLAGVTAVEDISGVAPLPELLPPNWEGKYTPHFVEINEDFDIVTNVAWDWTAFKEMGITHVAVLEGPPVKGVEPIYFNGESVIGNAVLVWYRAATAEFYFLHCDRCAVMLLKWIQDEQEAWATKCAASVPQTKARN